MENNLKLLSLARDFYVKESYDGCYTVRVTNSDLTATIYTKEKRIEYGMLVGDIYYEEFVRIDMDKLNKLQEFCELLMKEGE